MRILGINECSKYNVPKPNYKYDFSGVVVEFHKHTEKSLLANGLNESLVKIVLYVQGNGKISNTEVQKICDVSKRTASRYLSDLEGIYLEKKGDTGKGTFYSLKGSV